MKTLIAIVVLATTLALEAQAQENTLLVYGMAGFSSEKVEMAGSDVKTNSYIFKPGVGYQFTDKLTAGLNFGFEGSKTPSEDDDITIKTSSFEIGPFVRYTQSLSDIFSVFGQLDLNYQSSTIKNDDTDEKIKGNGFVGRLWPAVAINVKNGFALNFKFGEISYGTAKIDDLDLKTNSFKVDFNWANIQIGISKNFSFKK